MCNILLPPGVNPIALTNISYYNIFGSAVMTWTRDVRILIHIPSVPVYSKLYDIGYSVHTKIAS